MKKLKAFTLAEVLIVMGIIGVLAILTVPNMLSNVDARKRATSFKKAYSTLSNIYSSYFTGSIQAPRMSTIRDTNNLYLALLEKLSIDYYYPEGNAAGVTTANGGADVTTAAKAYTTTTTTASTFAQLGTNNDYATTWIKTTDGMSYLIGKAGADNTACADRLALNDPTNNGTLTNALDHTCMWVTVDFNAEKAPNTHCAFASATAEGTREYTDNDISQLSNCDRLTFLLSRSGFTPGNPERTIAGKMIGGE